MVCFKFWFCCNNGKHKKGNENAYNLSPAAPVIIGPAKIGCNEISIADATYNLRFLKFNNNKGVNNVRKRKILEINMYDSLILVLLKRNINKPYKCIRVLLGIGLKK